jgi:hypothetical protein
MIVMHRRSYRVVAGPLSPSRPATVSGGLPNQKSGSGDDSGSSSSGSVRIELAGVPFMVQCESFRSCAHAYTHLVEQAMRYATPGIVLLIFHYQMR